jgi:rubrerythrin
MPNLAILPLAPVHSIDEMLALAHAMEREAAARYAMLADCMRRVDQRAIAELLDGLAAEERDHVESVERLAQKVAHHVPDPNLVRWQLPETFGRGDEVSAAALLSPYRALSIAVRNEERAFAFWTYVAAQTGDGPLRELAETFARQELIHAAKLRHARRQAYHRERNHHPRIPRDTDDRPNPAAVRTEAAALESELAGFCARAAERLRSAADAVTVELFEDFANEGHRAAAALAASVNHAASPADRQPPAWIGEGHGTNSAALLFEAAGMIEDLNYRYLDWLEATSTEALARELEARARATTLRLARTNERLYALEPSLAAIGGGSGNE